MSPSTTASDASESPSGGGSSDLYRQTASSSSSTIKMISPTHGTVVGDAGGWDAQAKPARGGGRAGVVVKVEEGEEGEEGESVKGKKTRKRKPSSCVQCRRKKLRCNRGDPCDQCTLRNDANGCQWDDAVPLFSSRVEHDAQELRNQVARLESLVQHLTSQHQNASPLPEPHSYFDATASPSGHPSGHPSTGSVGSTSPTLAEFPHTTRNTLDPEPKAYEMDLRANDLCEALSHLAIREFVVVEGSGGDAWVPGGGSSEVFLDEARVFMNTLPQRFGLTGQMPAGLSGQGFDGLGEWGSGASSFGGGSSGVGSPGSDYVGALSPSPLSSAVFHRSAPPLADVLRFLPTDKQARSAYIYYCGYVSWYSHPVHLPTFELQWAQMKEALKLDGPARDKAIDPFWIATFLGVLSMGLSMMPEARALRDGFPADKDKVVDHWLEGAMVALTCGRFLDNPSVEAVRAVTIISTFFVFLAKGESSGAGMGLLTLAVQVSMTLGLHRDPDRSPSKFSFFEAEERRRLFWNLFMLCILSSSSLGRTWALFDLGQIDTKLPLDALDLEILDETAAKKGTEERRRKSEETPMTSLLCKIRLAVMAKKLNDAAFGIKPVAYKTILDLDRDLKEFEETIPARYQLRLDSVGALVRKTTHITVTEMRACMIQISVASEFIRLHRPWIVLASTDPKYNYSRDQVIHYSKLLLAIYRSPSCASACYGGLAYKATSAAVVLGIEVLTFPDGSEADALRAVVRATALQLEKHMVESSLCRKGARILRFLLEKDTFLLTMREEDRRAMKRQRTQASTSAPLHRLRVAFDLSRPAPLKKNQEDDERESDDRRRKVSRSSESSTSASSPSPSFAYPSPSPTLPHFPQFNPMDSSPSMYPRASVPTHKGPLRQPPAQPHADPVFQPLDFGGGFDFNFVPPIPIPSYPPDDNPPLHYSFAYPPAYDQHAPAAPHYSYPPTPTTQSNIPSVLQQQPTEKSYFSTGSYPHPYPHPPPRSFY